VFRPMSFAGLARPLSRVTGLHAYVCACLGRNASASSLESVLTGGGGCPGSNRVSEG